MTRWSQLSVSRMRRRTTIVPSATTGFCVTDPTARIAASGGLITAVNWSMSNMPRFETENVRSEEHTSELQSQSNLVCRLLLEKKKQNTQRPDTRTTKAQRRQRRATG